MLRQMSLEVFGQAVASDQAVPGGGSVSALAGGLAAALTSMVAALTLKKEIFAAVAPVMEKIRDEADGLHAALLAAVDQDADSYRRVLDAFRLPKTTVEEKKTREKAVQAAFEHATKVPLHVAELSFNVMELAAKAAVQGNQDMVTDAGVGVLMARSAALGALMNVRINLASLKDGALVERLRAKAAALGKAVIQREKEILATLDIV